MGIPRFAFYISNRYPLIVKKIEKEADVPEIDNLYLDINGIIHNASRNYHCDASIVNETTKLIYKDVCEVIKKIVHIIRPKKLLMISADGVAPRAKMNQQRIRRFRKELENKNNQNGNDIIFDSNAISAGTKFMFNLSTYMKEYIINEKKINKEWSDIEILLTGSDEPGEGEHKILEYIRNYKNSEKYNPYTRHCIYGLDADLIILSLITHENNIVILREDTFKIKKINKLLEKGIEIINNDNNKKEPYEFLLISVLREYLELEFGYLKNKIKFKFNLERIIDDFIFITFFIGNDFIPNLFHFNIDNGSLKHLFQFYKECIQELDGYLIDKGKINFQRLKTFFGYLSKNEFHSIDMLIKNKKNKNENKENRAKRANDSKEQIISLKKQKKEEKKQKLIADIQSKTKEEQIKFKKDKINKKISQIKKKFQEISQNDFNEEFNKYKNIEENKNNETLLSNEVKELFSKAKKYEKYIEDENYCSDFKNEDVDDSDVSDIDTKEIINEVAQNMKEIDEKENDEKEDEDDINLIFYQKLKGMKSTSEAKELYYKEKLNIDITTEEGKKQRDQLFNVYLEGLQWILYYYYKGIKNWKWYYPYYYTPMISDFQEIKLNKTTYEQFDIFDKITSGAESEPFKPYQSLLFILPQQSYNLLPKCYSDIPSKVPEYFPEKIDIDYNGKTASYESLLLLPFLEDKKILELEETHRKLEPEEEKENNWGSSLLFKSNELNANELEYNVYEFYNKKNMNENEKNHKNNNIPKKCDFSFPTLKTIDYDYELINVKQFYGKTCSMTKQILILPKMKEKINNKKINQYLHKNTIFIDYPSKALAKINGFIYGRFYHYLYKNTMYIDSNFRLSKEVIESIRNSYEKKGIKLEHPEILCDVTKFEEYNSFKDKNKKTNIYWEYKPYYVPFEITSLNSTSNDFDKYILHFDVEKNKKYIKK